MKDIGVPMSYPLSTARGGVSRDDGTGVICHRRLWVNKLGCGQIPGQGLRGQVKPLKVATVPIVETRSPYIK